MGGGLRLRGRGVEVGARSLDLQDEMGREWTGVRCVRAWPLPK